VSVLAVQVFVRLSCLFCIQLCLPPFTLRQARPSTDRAEARTTTTTTHHHRRPHLADVPSQVELTLQLPPRVRLPHPRQLRRQVAIKVVVCIKAHVRRPRRHGREARALGAAAGQAPRRRRRCCCCGDGSGAAAVAAAADWKLGEGGGVRRAAEREEGSYGMIHHLEHEPGSTSPARHARPRRAEGL